MTINIRMEFFIPLAPLLLVILLYKNIRKKAPKYNNFLDTPLYSYFTHPSLIKTNYIFTYFFYIDHQPHRGHW